MTLRVGRLEFTRLGWAFALSLALHLLFWGGYAMAKHFDLAAKLHLPRWMQHLMTPPPVQAKTPPPVREPFMFVDVREEQALPEPPKNATRYSDRNALATNPDANKEADAPKIDGAKNDLHKLEESGQKNKFDQLMPDPPKAAVQPTPQPKPKPGTMTVAKAELKPPQERQRPRTIKEAMLQKNLSPGKRSQQDGGVAKRGHISEDVKVTGFGVYDRAFIDAVRDRWYNLLGSLSYEGYREGKVVVQFTLNFKGEISDVTVLESTVTETLKLMCEKAILDPAPFEKWTREMRLAVGEDSRRITFTFNYITFD